MQRTTSARNLVHGHTQTEQPRSDIHPPEPIAKEAAGLGPAIPVRAASSSFCCTDAVGEGRCRSRGRAPSSLAVEFSLCSGIRLANSRTREAADVRLSAALTWRRSVCPRE